MKRNLLISYRGANNQIKMAKKYNVTQQTWCNWENCISTPDAVTMKRLELDSGIPMEQLFSDIFNKNKLFQATTSA